MTLPPIRHLHYQRRLLQHRRLRIVPTSSSSTSTTTTTLTPTTLSTPTLRPPLPHRHVHFDLDFHNVFNSSQVIQPLLDRPTSSTTSPSAVLPTSSDSTFFFLPPASPPSHTASHKRSHLFRLNESRCALALFQVPRCKSALRALGYYNFHASCPLRLLLPPPLALG